ncbi:hypothetical protein CONCODRAFT_9325 [Conidiobolus coronatus NRRL 28638]|uniref:Uncharacterized protein n=1 Tax=Conidiobolus coronatus (strain ATCC 28846 / CBS 209.66 / NRRL 28638) TaxID=796925 RepID=A0A137P035_CONC2|nr:hypothetical protein CONCODRAFT_9325 [Conidiobolus coronatus NRRL 28638]|eukprot:KXN68433.1 hypothetical protein CONCODRAFT_9325 [Conidiobolus coronatus NRRL 28638]
MYLQRRSYDNSLFKGILISSISPIIVFISFSMVIFFAYHKHKNNQKKRAARSAENAGHELSVYNQTSANRDHGERRQERPENNGLSNEFCDPLPLYIPPGNSIQTQAPQYVENQRVKSPPYSVS